ncbi:MAG: hypothetical protein WD044_16255 [Dongiaceae bacterium]
MTVDSQFWLQFGTQAVLAIATIVVAVVAVFGERIRARIYPPMLNLKLLDAKGSLSPTYLTSPDGSTRTEDSRWYHVEVRNDRRWSPARQVQVNLVRVEEPDASGVFQITWRGALPFRWRYQEIHPISRTLGAPADCDLCCVVKEKWFELSSLIDVTSLKSRREQPFRMIVTLRAQSIEVDSKFLRLEIVWNGLWSDDSATMARNLVIKAKPD